MTERLTHTREDREDPRDYKKEKGRHYSEQTGHAKRGEAAKADRKVKNINN